MTDFSHAKRSPSGKTVLLFLALTIAIHSYMFLVNLPQLLAQSGGVLLFDLVPTGYDLAYAEAFLTALGEEGRCFYFSRQWALDMVYPAVYGLGGAVLWRWLIGKHGNPTNWMNRLVLLPVLSAAVDYIENTLIGVMLLRFPDVSGVVVRWASFATTCKYLLLMLFLLSVLWLAVTLIRQHRA